MKKLIYIFAAIALIGCDKKEIEQETILSKEEQKIQNTKLLGTWKSTTTSNGSNRMYYVFEDNFKFSYYTILEATGHKSYNYTNEPYTIPRIGWIDFTLLENNGRGYRFEGESLFITDAWEVEFKKIE